jgi:hypothetical protein
MINKVCKIALEEKMLDLLISYIKQNQINEMTGNFLVKSSTTITDAIIVFAYQQANTIIDAEYTLDHTGVIFIKLFSAFQLNRVGYTNLDSEKAILNNIDIALEKAFEIFIKYNYSDNR